jgi:tetratricopeptide (TPR) repeat protein
MSVKTSSIVLVLLAALIGACASSDKTAPASSTSTTLRPPDGMELHAVVLPDLSRVEAPVQRQLREGAAALISRIEDRQTASVDLGAVYGEMGKLLMAAQYLDAAESCFLNAQSLVPADRRWPYYLGRLYKVKGPLAKSVASFERALQLAPDDVATLIWLGEAHLAEGRADAAAPLFARALRGQPNSIAARFGAGRAALAVRDYAGAVTYLEQGLALNPRVAAFHYPLALAYRGLGRVAEAEAHMRQRGGSDVLPADPLMQELEDLLQSPMAYDLRGTRALEIGDWGAATAYFRKGLELAPDDATLRHRLGTTLAQIGDTRGAVEQFEQVIRTSPEFSKAYYSLGVLMEADGRQQDAIDRYSTAVKYEPTYVQARVRLAGVLRRTARLEESLAQYEQALETDPTSAAAAFGYAMTLIHLQRYDEARDRLAQGMTTYPDRTAFARALARLLAVAPSERVRDGRRAKSLAEDMLKHQQTADVAETLAMALAEVGQYAQAAALQRQLAAAAARAGRGDLVPRLNAALALYERGKPNRTFWEDEEWD